jgi:hypothetical protein
MGMLRAGMSVAAVAHGWLWRLAPSNRILAATRTRRGLPWGIPVMLVGAAYWWAAAALTVAIGRGGPGWLHIGVMVCLWSGLKLVLNGPVTLVLLARARLAEARETRTPTCPARPAQS